VLAGAEIRFVDVAAMRAHLEGRLAAARSELEATRARREELHAEVLRLVAEKDRAEATWRYKTEEDLRRRLHLQYNPPSRPEDYHAIQRAYREDKRVAYERAVAAVARAEAREREYEAETRVAARLRGAAFLTDGLPPALVAVPADEGGRFEAVLPPGRYAVVAGATTAGDDARTLHWLLWLDVAPDGETPLRLGSQNLHGTDCASCIVQRRDLP
jgi:hypothetical protein